MRQKKILVINICKEKLAYYEFVKPIEDILKKNRINYVIKNYEKVVEKDLREFSMAIICGTTIFDNKFLDDINYFLWIRDFNKHILGICGGMHVIGLVFGGKLESGTEIGYYFEDFKKEFLGLKGICEVYHLHGNYTDFSKLKGFEIFSGNKVSQAVKHKTKSIYGVLFHPEVRNRDMILEFVNKG